ncbi:TraR/DksA C4-type zinc finger protein [Patescibacteria group bacterium]|nr:TraR/DksA C4-type zinc finger protein [Patescibacteria group bacterium]
MARMEIVRFNKKLTCLVNRKKDFLADPVEYQKCEECGKKIPKERLEEVPHCRHCVKCKNNIHNGNNCH